MNKYTIILLSALLTGGACNNEKNQADNNVQHDHEHAYSCPMHPEVTGHEGDKCPKCGMTLELKDNGGKSETYKMLFRNEPANLAAGQEVTLIFTPKIIGKDSEQVPLDLEHEKKIHLIMVSEDLSWFDHQHPEYNADGSYSLRYSFPNGGKHFLFADYKPAGANHQLEKTEIDVSGKAPAAVSYKEPKLISKSGDYELELVPSGGKFESGAQLHIAAKLKKNSKAIDPAGLENYLGAKAHVVAISVDEKSYMHVHPDVADSAFDLHATFDKAGFYRVWIQFKADGKIHTTDFVVKVEQGSGKPESADHKGHEGHKH